MPILRKTTLRHDVTEYVPVAALTRVPSLCQVPMTLQLQTMLQFVMA